MIKIRKYKHSFSDNQYINLWKGLGGLKDLYYVTPSISLLFFLL